MCKPAGTTGRADQPSMRKYLVAIVLALTTVSTAWCGQAPDAKNYVIAVTASWCGPCQKDKKFYGHVPGLVVIDVDEWPGAVRKYRVNGLPTYIVVRGGVETYRTHNIQELF